VLLSEVGQFGKVEQQVPPGFQIGPEAAFSAGSVSSLFAAAIASVPNMPRHRSKSNSNSRNQLVFFFTAPAYAQSGLAALAPLAGIGQAQDQMAQRMLLDAQTREIEL
jgi:hypothetical protein